MNNNDQRSLKGVALIGLAMMLLLGVIAIIGDSFEHGQQIAKPTVAVVAMLLVATALSVWAIRLGLRIADGAGQLLWLILCVGIGFRAVMLLTPPILEVDYYRYLWDGKVVQAGVSPYRYSPQVVIDASLPQSPAAADDEDLETLVGLANAPSNHEILSRVHYPKLTTIYPPTSQLVFWLVAKTVPSESSVRLHVLIIRAAFVLFDVGTIVLLAMMLRQLDRHLAWLMAYAWNPLVIKEIANSGHLDSLAVFLIVLAAMMLLNVRGDRSLSSALASGFALGLAVGAKLFPVILVPAFVARLSAFGWRVSAGFCSAFFIVCLVVLYPMSDNYFANIDFKSAQRDTIHNQSDDSERTSPLDSDGLSEFLSTWRMNDAIFSAVYFNLKPESDTARNYWYVITPSELRQQVAQLENHQFFRANPAFALTRLLTLAVFGVFYLVMLRRFRRSDEQGFLCGILILLALFLMLQPTINPWYWVWVVPFTCFSSRWSWPAISGVLLIYYIRFCFIESSLEFECWQCVYQGVQIFDHFVVWIELILIIAFVTIAGRLDAKQSTSRPVL